MPVTRRMTRHDMMPASVMLSYHDQWLLGRLLAGGRAAAASLRVSAVKVTVWQFKLPGGRTGPPGPGPGPDCVRLRLAAGAAAGNSRSPGPAPRARDKSHGPGPQGA